MVVMQPSALLHPVMHTLCHQHLEYGQAGSATSVMLSLECLCRLHM